MSSLTKIRYTNLKMKQNITNINQKICIMINKRLKTINLLTKQPTTFESRNLFIFYFLKYQPHLSTNQSPWSLLSFLLQILSLIYLSIFSLFFLQMSYGLARIELSPLSTSSRWTIINNWYQEIHKHCSSND